MIATHNSFTYKRSTNKLFEYFNCFWRCQTKTIKEQFDSGVRFFDIRVYKKKDSWNFAHGLVNLYGGVNSLEVLYRYLCMTFPSVKCRLILEKGDSSTFIEEINSLKDKYESFGNVVYQCIIKKGWEIIYSSNEDFQIIDYCYTPIISNKSLLYNLTHFKISTIKRYAKKHNPIITQKMKEDVHVIYFMDFI